MSAETPPSRSRSPHEVRPAVETDAAGLVDLLGPIVEAGRYTVMEGPVTLDSQREFMACFPERGILHVAVAEGGELLGVQDVVPARPADEPAFSHVGEVSTFVRPEAWRRGVGRALSEVTFRRSAELGFGKLSATVRCDNPQAVAFYRSQGFRVVGTLRAHAFVGGRYLDEILLELVLR